MPIGQLNHPPNPLPGPPGSSSACRRARGRVDAAGCKVRKWREEHRPASESSPGGGPGGGDGKDKGLGSDGGDSTSEGGRW